MSSTLSSTGGSNHNIIIFKSICAFIKELYAEYGDQYIEIKLYNHLLEKTGLMNTKPIEKHITAFSTFLEINRDAVETMNIAKIKEPCIRYSDKVFVDIGKLIKNTTNTETVVVIWKHLLYIWSQIDPASRAKNLLKETCSANEFQFLGNIIDGVSQTVLQQQRTNPNGQINLADMMGSQVFGDIIGGLSSGNFDIGKLVGTVGNLLTKASPDGMIPPEAQQMMNMIQPFLADLSKKQGTLPTIAEDAGDSDHSVESDVKHEQLD